MARMTASAVSVSASAVASRASARAAREMGGRATSVSGRVMVTSTPMRSRGRRPAARAARRTTGAVGVGGAGGDADADRIEGVELGLGRAAMLGFLGTTVGDVLTRGDGPIEQLTMESSYVARHVNPMEIARDALELGGFYIESVVLVWLVLGSALLLGFSQGMRNPIRTVSGRNAGQRAQASAAAFSEIEKAYETNVREQKPYELFNGRLAMLGTAFAFVGDVETGGLGPLEQVNQEFGIPVVDEEIFAILFLAGVSFNVVSTGVTAFRRAYAKGRE
jgi:photosystem II protein